MDKHELDAHGCRMFAAMVRQVVIALTRVGNSLIHTASTLDNIAGAERMSDQFKVLGALMVGFCDDIVAEAGKVLAPTFGEGTTLDDPRLDI
jgi:hypothetical protein